MRSWQIRIQSPTAPRKRWIDWSSSPTRWRPVIGISDVSNNLEREETSAIRPRVRCPKRHEFAVGLAEVELNLTKVVRTFDVSERGRCLAVCVRDQLP